MGAYSEFKSKDKGGKEFTVKYTTQQYEVGLYVVTEMNGHRVSQGVSKKSELQFHKHERKKHAKDFVDGTSIEFLEYDDKLRRVINGTLKGYRLKGEIETKMCQNVEVPCVKHEAFTKKYGQPFYVGYYVKDSKPVEGIICMYVDTPKGLAHAGLPGADIRCIDLERAEMLAELGLKKYAPTKKKLQAYIDMYHS